MYEPLKERMNNGAKAQQPPKATAVAARPRLAYREHDVGGVGRGSRRGAPCELKAAGASPRRRRRRAAAVGKEGDTI